MQSEKMTANQNILILHISSERFWTNEILAWAELCRVTGKIYKTTN